MRSTISLRGHHILCIQYYKGLGYSPEFVANMSAIIDRLSSASVTAVNLTTAPDDICRACPNLVDGSCCDDGTDAEEKRSQQDRVVLDVLELRSGDELSWAEIMEILRSRGAALPMGLCGACRWANAGHCGFTKTYL